MWCRVQRWPAGQPVEPFAWVGAAPQLGAGDPEALEIPEATMVGGPGGDLPHSIAHPAPHPALHPAPQLESAPADFAALEREAFAEGFAVGERAGNEAAATRSEAMLRRLATTIDDLAGLRSDMARNAERQLVELAVAIARRITLHELSIDRTLLAAMARAALDRLGDAAAATIHLNPDDHRAIVPSGDVAPDSASVRVVADSSIAPGGCIVQSELGLIDAGLDAQLAEITGALIGGAPKGEDVVFVAA
jgi:flagellar assembly protein FliH